jgi:hypothetical protein
VAAMSETRKFILVWLGILAVAAAVDYATLIGVVKALS